MYEAREIMVISLYLRIVALVLVNGRFTANKMLQRTIYSVVFCVFAIAQFYAEKPRYKLPLSKALEFMPNICVVLCYAEISIFTQR